ncbi:hypothetical protein NUW58_g6301 [Xylaria curta]|uniref:Uncharacterized protein n=1 Tax=Xylaria curta TaxID=42375 RepID=A0ACC1NW07_9PEZI|nr:hypothetical protein NUW58_g6301 [Xylaria curta]
MPTRGNAEKQHRDSRLGGDEDDNADIVYAPVEQVQDDEEKISATERELRELEDEEVRRTNAYPGATNSISSVHQRRWYLSLNREASGFAKRRRNGKTVWESTDVHSGARLGALHTAEDEKSEESEATARLDYPFYVRGAEHERSVVTGRLGSEVLRDEGVIGYIGRKGWQAILK